jgi:hypothetical protein
MTLVEALEITLEIAVPGCNKDDDALQIVLNHIEALKKKELT